MEGLKFLWQSLSFVLFEKLFNPSSYLSLWPQNGKHDFTVNAQSFSTISNKLGCFWNKELFPWFKRAFNLTGIDAYATCQATSAEEMKRLKGRMF